MEGKEGGEAKWKQGGKEGHMGRKVGRVGGRVEEEGRLDGKGWMGKEGDKQGGREGGRVEGEGRLDGKGWMGKEGDKQGGREGGRNGTFISLTSWWTSIVVFI